MEEERTGEKLIFNIGEFDTVDIQRDMSHDGIELVLEGKGDRKVWQWKVSSPDKAARVQRAKGTNPTGLTTQGGHVVGHTLDETADIVGFPEDANTGRDTLEPAERRQALGGVMNVCTLEALADQVSDYLSRWDQYVQEQEGAERRCRWCRRS